MPQSWGEAVLTMTGNAVEDQYRYFADSIEFMQELLSDMYRRINGPCMNGECTQEDLDKAINELYEEIYGQ